MFGLPAGLCITDTPPRTDAHSYRPDSSVPGPFLGRGPSFKTVKVQKGPHEMHPTTAASLVHPNPKQAQCLRQTPRQEGPA